MRNAGLILILVVVLGGGYFVYQSYLTSSNLAEAPPQEQINAVGIRSDLLMMAGAELQYFAINSRYASLNELKADNRLPRPTEARGYIYTATVDGDRSFVITARPADPAKSDWPTFSVDQSMQVSSR
jgi:hypothetical protein